MAIFIEMEKSILKFVQNFKGPRIATIISEEESWKTSQFENIKRSGIKQYATGKRINI